MVVNENLFKLSGLPKHIGDKITFKVENSPNRHGKIVEFLIYSEENTITVIGYKVKCKNNSFRNVLFNDVIHDQDIS